MKKIRSDIELLQNPKQKKRTIACTIFFILSLIFIFILYGFVSAFFTSEPIEGEEYNEPNVITRSFKKLVFSDNRLLDGYKEDRINVLFLGIGGAGHDGPQLSDTMILSSFKPSTNKVAMLSIPRDIAVNIPGYGVKKINHANAYGEEKNPGKGGDLTSEIIESNLNVPIHYWIRVDFKAFEEIIDAIDGLEIEIEQTFIDEQYPTDDFGVQTIVFEAGRELMDGKRALMYARSRHGSHGEGTDFARAKRQQKILKALREKILTPSTLANPKKIASLFNTLQKHIDTNLTLLEILDFIKEGKNINPNEVINHVITTGENGLLQEINNDYGYFLIPKSGDFEEITNFIENMFEINPPLPPKRVEVDVSDIRDAKIIILNGTWEPGLAAQMRESLESENIQIHQIGNTPERTFKKTIIYQLAENEKINAALTRISPLINTEIIHETPDFSIDNKADIVIIVGIDWYQQQQNQ